MISCFPRNNLAQKEETCRGLTWLEGSKNPFFRLRGQGGRIILDDLEEVTLNRFTLTCFVVIFLPQSQLQAMTGALGEDQSPGAGQA